MFAKPEDGLGYCIKHRRMCAPLLPRIGESGGVVGKEGHRPALKKRQETLDPVEYCKEFPVVDRKGRPTQRPQAGQVVVL